MSRRWRRSLDRQAVRPDEERARLERAIEQAVQEDQHRGRPPGPRKPPEGPAVTVVEKR